MDPITQQTVLAAAGAAGGPKVYVDDVFSTALYEGNASSNTVPSGLDFSEGSWLSWIKLRDGSDSHFWSDSTQKTGVCFDSIASDRTYGKQTGETTGINAVGTSSYSIQGGNAQVNGNTKKYASWNFKAAPGFFDVVTFSASSNQIPHSLGSTPGMMLVKRTDAASDWYVYHRSFSNPNANYMVLNGSSAVQSGINGNWEATDTYFKFQIFGIGTWVAYIFAHDDAQFGTGGDESIIKCGSYGLTSGFSNQTIDLGFEPQWLLIKRTDSAKDWQLLDNMRGLTDVNTPRLRPNLSNSENTIQPGQVLINPTGFTVKETIPDLLEGPSSNYIYMAIRRPNKPPEVATEVFDDVAYTGLGNANTVSFSPTFADLIWIKNLVYGYPHVLVDRLRGGTKYVASDANTGETNLATADSVLFDRQESFKIPGPGYSGGQTNNGNGGYNSYISWIFKRAPGFFDVVAYTGTGSARTENHNLTVTPEMMLVKKRSSGDSWQVYHSSMGPTKYSKLDSTAAFGTSGGTARWNDTAPTSSVFTIGNDGGVNASGSTYIAYLFATLPGISKLGSYTGTGNAINVNCGFTSGARFVLIKRTDDTGDWYVWDTARGIVSGNDPYLVHNTTAAEVTNTDYIDPLNAGFTVTSSAPTSLNASGGTYIFLAIA